LTTSCEASSSRLLVDVKTRYRSLCLAHRASKADEASTAVVRGSSAQSHSTPTAGQEQQTLRLDSDIKSFAGRQQ
jgi:hypothetical protein